VKNCPASSRALEITGSLLGRPSRGGKSRSDTPARGARVTPFESSSLILGRRADATVFRFRNRRRCVIARAAVAPQDWRTPDRRRAGTRFRRRGRLTHYRRR